MVFFKRPNTYVVGEVGIFDRQLFENCGNKPKGANANRPRGSGGSGAIEPEIVAVAQLLLALRPRRVPRSLLAVAGHGQRLTQMVLQHDQSTLDGQVIGLAAGLAEREDLRALSAGGFL